MKSDNILKSWLRGSCVWFTFISLAMLIFGMMFSKNANYVATLSFLLFYPCALCLSAAGLLYKNEKLGKGLRRLLHYLITLLAFILFIWLPSGASVTFPFVLLLFCLLTAIYWLIVLALHILRAAVVRICGGK